MTRIDPTLRKPPENTKFYGPRLSRQKRTRATNDIEYLATSDIYKEENQRCAYCKEHLAPEDLQNDHIVSGTAGRAASLLNFDTWNLACPPCHDEPRSRAEKAAAKLVQVLDAIEGCWGQNFSAEDEKLILQRLRKRLTK